MAEAFGNIAKGFFNPFDMGKLVFKPFIRAGILIIVSA